MGGCLTACTKVFLFCQSLQRRFSFQTSQLSHLSKEHSFTIKTNKRLTPKTKIVKGQISGRRKTFCNRCCSLHTKLKWTKKSTTRSTSCSASSPLAASLSIWTKSFSHRSTQKDKKAASINTVPSRSSKRLNLRLEMIQL